MQTRRNFLIDTLTVAAAAATIPNLSFAPPKKQIGIQLWSVRDALKQDFEGTIKALGEGAFNYVEGFGYENGAWLGQNLKDFKAMLKRYDLKMPTAHYTFKSSHYDNATKTVTDEWKKTVDDALKIGQKYLISPWTDESERLNPDTYKRYVDKMNVAAEYCKAKGLRFGYHNHWFEFDKIGDELMYDILLKNTDTQTVTMELDLCWAVFAKQNPVDWFNKYPGRFELIHAKDVKPGATTYDGATAIVGKGAVNFKEVIANARKAGIKMFIVELEHYETTSVQDVNTARKNLKLML